MSSERGRLAFLVLAAIVLREAAAAYLNVHPTLGLPVPDPDSYLTAGALLSRGGWHWTFDVTAYAGFVKAPLYPIFLSLFARTADFPRLVPYAQALLSASSVVSVFVLASLLHSRRAGVIAAAAATVWFSNVVSPAGIWQEQLYAPLLVASIALLAVALDRGRAQGFFAAGVVLGCTALVRAMPIYLVVATAIAWVWIHEPRPARRTHLLAWIAGFLVVTLPYIAAVSRHAGQLILIENIGFFHLNRYDPPGHPFSAALTGAPGAMTAARTLARQASADPVWVARRFAFRVREQATPTGLPWLRFYYVASSEPAARAAAWIVHLWGDVPEAMVLLLAPLGAVLAKRRPLAALVALWCGVSIVAVAVAGHGGPRFRFPIESLLVALSACVVAGEWRRPTVRAIGAAVASSLLVAAALVHFAPLAAAARPDYGLVKWEWHLDRRLNEIRGPAGFNIAAYRGAIRFRVRCRSGSACGAVGVTIDGRRGRTLSEEDARSSNWYSVGGLEEFALSYVELSPPPGVQLDLDVDDPGLEPAIMAGSTGFVIGLS